MFVVAVLFVTKADSVEAFRKAVLQQARNSLEKEEGCSRFDVCFDGDRPERVFLYEIYDDRAAFDLHLASDHMKDFDKVSGPLVESKAVDFWSLQPQG